MSKKWYFTGLWSRSKPKQRTIRGQRGQPEDRRQRCFPKTSNILSIEEQKFKIWLHNPFSSFSNASTSSAPLGDHNDTFCSIMEAPLLARLSAIFNLFPLVGENKQAGSTDVWRHSKTVHKRVSSTAWKQTSCIFIHHCIIKKLFFPRQHWLNALAWNYIRWTSLLRRSVINVDTQLLFQPHSDQIHFNPLCFQAFSPLQVSSPD